MTDKIKKLIEELEAEIEKLPEDTKVQEFYKATFCVDLHLINAHLSIWETKNKK